MPCLPRNLGKTGRPKGLVEAELPLDRAPYKALVTAVLAWKTLDLAPCELGQIGPQLTGHARAVAADVTRRADQLPPTAAGAVLWLLPQDSDLLPSAARLRPGAARRSTAPVTALTTPGMTAVFTI
ncbi:hypothetical protein ACIPSA_48160 [Streptomyces sp. NPDC086549]|uniref:hypothetical protein n=1 Tax=Streptomyces sp. NPDC086549 TaxID=3365752 RepID=UPI00381DD509